MPAMPVQSLHCRGGGEEYFIKKIIGSVVEPEGYILLSFYGEDSIRGLYGAEVVCFQERLQVLNGCW